MPESVKSSSSSANAQSEGASVSSPESSGGRGLRGDARDRAQLAAVIQTAVNYRGDVTITLRQGSELITGYIFDFANPHNVDRAAVRLLPASGEGKRSIALREIAAIELTGRDTAEGKSFETWVRKYVERKRAGQSANIESEPLDPPG